jgi:hypothetical protein
MKNKLSAEDYYDLICSSTTKAMPLFTLYGWCYQDGVVTHSQLRNTITRLVNKAVEEYNKTNRAQRIGSGRIYVSIDEYEEGAELRIDLELGSQEEFYDIKPRKVVVQ